MPHSRGINDFFMLSYWVPNKPKITQIEMFSSFIYFLESDFSVVGFIFDLFLTSFRGEKYFYVLSSGDMLGGLRVGREGFTG